MCPSLHASRNAARYLLLAASACHSLAWSCNIFLRYHFQAEGLLTYEIHPPQNRVESYGESGESEIKFELDEKAFLDVRDRRYRRYTRRLVVG